MCSRDQRSAIQHEAASSFRPPNGTRANLCGRSREPKPPRHGGCRDERTLSAARNADAVTPSGWLENGGEVGGGPKPDQTSFSRRWAASRAACSRRFGLYSRSLTSGASEFRMTTRERRPSSSATLSRKMLGIETTANQCKTGRLCANGSATSNTIVTTMTMR